MSHEVRCGQIRSQVCPSRTWTWILESWEAAEKSGFLWTAGEFFTVKNGWFNVIWWWFNGDLMGFHVILWWFNGDFMVLNGDEWWFECQ